MKNKKNLDSIAKTLSGIALLEVGYTKTPTLLNRRIEHADKVIGEYK